MDAVGVQSDDVIAEGKERLATVDDDGVTFKSHLDGSRHRFTPEVSMQIQHQLGADIMFAFDELTTLLNTRGYQEKSVDRTQAWAVRCIDEHQRLTKERVGKPYQALFGVMQGAQYEDLRRKAAHDLETIVGRERARLRRLRHRRRAREAEPRHHRPLGERGTARRQTAPHARHQRTGRLLRRDRERRGHLRLRQPVAGGPQRRDLHAESGRFNINTSRFRRDFTPIDEDCDCYTCAHYTRAYMHHLFKAKEMLASTLVTIHNERFTVKLVDDIRDSHRRRPLRRVQDRDAGAVLLHAPDPVSTAESTDFKQISILSTVISARCGWSEARVRRLPLLDVRDDAVRDRHDQITSTSVFHRKPTMHVVDEVFPRADADHTGGDGAEDEGVGELADDGRADQSRPQMLLLRALLHQTSTSGIEQLPDEVTGQACDQQPRNDTDHGLERRPGSRRSRPRAVRIAIQKQATPGAGRRSPGRSRGGWP